MGPRVSPIGRTERKATVRLSLFMITGKRPGGPVGKWSDPAQGGLFSYQLMGA